MTTTRGRVTKRNRNVSDSLINLSKQQPYKNAVEKPKKQKLNPPINVNVAWSIYKKKSPGHKQVDSNMFTEKVHIIFKIIDSVHDMFEGKGHSKHIASILMNKTIGLKQQGYGEDWFTNIVFNFEDTFGKDEHHSIHKRERFTADTFKLWLSKYLEISKTCIAKNTCKAQSLSDIKEGWKIKLFTLAQQYNYTFMEMNFGSKVLPYLQGSSDRILTKKFTAGYISSYGLLLATDALKTSDEMNTKQNIATMSLSPLAKRIGKFDVSNNYICNMAQIIDPASNIKLDKLYRFALPRLLKTKNVRNTSQNPDSIFFELVSINTQITCSFNIKIEILTNVNNKIVKQIIKHGMGEFESDLLTDYIKPSEFFKYVRVFVEANPIKTESQINTSYFYNFTNVRGLCIQIPSYQGKNHLVEKFWIVHKKLAGYSINDVVQFIDKDVKKLKIGKKTKTKAEIAAELHVNTWLVRYYLDWKRMGDSFQITHLKDLSDWNKKKLITTKNMNDYNPYHFVSMDILAIVQCIIYGVNFVYQKDGNGFVIGNNVTDTWFTRYQQNKMTEIMETIKTERLKNKNLSQNQKAAGLLMTFAESTNNNRTN